MKLYWPGAWLGWAILLCAASAALQQRALGIRSAAGTWVLTDLLLAAWCFRGFVRWIWRQKRHVDQNLGPR